MCARARARVCVCVCQGRRQLLQSGASEGSSLRGSGGPPRRMFLEFRRQILHSARLPVQNHTSKLFLPGFGRSTWTDFLGSWYGHGRTGRTSGAGPVQSECVCVCVCVCVCAMCECVYVLSWT